MFLKQINTMPGTLAAVARGKLSTTEKGKRGRKKARKSQMNYSPELARRDWRERGER